MQDVLAANTQQGADDSLALAPHACHSAQTSSAQEVEQKGFCLVVAMMSYGNTLCSSLLDLAFEPPIAQFACRHLDAHVVQQGKFAGVEMLYRERDIEFPAQSGNKGFVAVRLLATQVKVAVQSMQAVAQLVPGVGDSLVVVAHAVVERSGFGMQERLARRKLDGLLYIVESGCIHAALDLHLLALIVEVGGEIAAREVLKVIVACDGFTQIAVAGQCLGSQQDDVGSSHGIRLAVAVERAVHQSYHLCCVGLALLPALGCIHE